MHIPTVLLRAGVALGSERARVKLQLKPWSIEEIRNATAEWNASSRLGAPRAVPTPLSNPHRPCGLGTTVKPALHPGARAESVIAARLTSITTFAPRDDCGTAISWLHHGGSRPSPGATALEDAIHVPPGLVAAEAPAELPPSLRESTVSAFQAYLDMRLEHAGAASMTSMSDEDDGWGSDFDDVSELDEDERLADELARQSEDRYLEAAEAETRHDGKPPLPFKSPELSAMFRAKRDAGKADAPPSFQEQIQKMATNLRPVTPVERDTRTETQQILERFLDRMMRTHDIKAPGAYVDSGIESEGTDGVDPDEWDA